MNTHSVPANSLNVVASTVAMIKPTNFFSNPETLISNSFQKSGTGIDPEKILEKAQNEFLNFQQTISSQGVHLLKFDENKAARTPDALFLNNWFCHLPDGRAFVFPMQPKNRRNEFRDDVIKSLNAKEVIDLRYLEKENFFLEGTGSLILDHQFKIGYACVSPRTSPQAVEIFKKISGYNIQLFNAFDLSGQAIYHTNVMMALSFKNAIVNLSAITNSSQRNALVESLIKTNRKIIDISHLEMNNFAGNMLFLKATKSNIWVCSEKAYKALSSQNRSLIEAEAPLVHANLDTIETFGGGGARCLLAEVFTQA